MQGTVAGSNLLDAESAAGLERLALLPFPRSVSFRGAPLRPRPSNFLYVSAEATVGTRRKCYVLTQRLQELGFRTAMETASRLGPNQALFTPSASFPKLQGLERPLPAQAAGHEGYRLAVTSDGALLHGADEQGMQNAGATLRQLLQDGPEVPGMDIEDYPLLQWRVIHLDFKGWPPTVEYLRYVIGLLSSVKINALILEYEAYFNYPSQPGLAGEGALTPAEMTDIDLFAQDNGVTLIPLVHCLGNVGYVLRLPAYQALREHPDFLLQYCPVNPQTLGVVSAMMEDLMAVHGGKFFHVGGDETRLLGTNPQSEARAKQLGGRAALYLEYIGKVCRYLMGSGRQPLVWDDMFRRMSDAQVQWLPPEAVLTAWQYEGQGGHVTPAILTNLDRYKRLGRRVWGAATRSPAKHYDAFDNIDAWTEAAEMGYLEGMITTAWTRDCSLGSMHAPPEVTWPAALYGAERVWSGLKGLTRERFPFRAMTRLFGVKDATVQGRLWSGYDMLMRDHPKRAREFFAKDLGSLTRNGGTAAFMESWSALEAFKEYVQQFEADISGNYANLAAGKGDPFFCGRLRWRVADLKSKIPGVVGRFRVQAGRITSERHIKEYLESSVTYGYARLEEMDRLLAAYPQPPKEWQQPVHM